MKKQIARTFAAAFALSLLISTAAHAQTARITVVQVPFDFYAGQRLMPAGRYSVRPISQDGAKMLLIRSEDGRTSAAVQTNTSADKAPSPGGSLTFRQYGDRYFLARIFITSASAGREVPASKAEKKLRNDLRAKAARPDAKSVTVIGSVQ